MITRLRSRSFSASLRSARREGFTLIELLIVILIIGLIIGFTLPAVLSAQESARRAQCSNNLRQIGLAIHGYITQHECFPPGRVKTFDPRYAGDHPPCTSNIIDRSIHVSILPHLEQGAVYNGINHDLTILGVENQTLHTMSISTFACPDDPASGVARNLNPGALANYGDPDPAGGPQRMVFTSYAGMTGPFESIALPTVSTNCHPSSLAVSQNSGVFNDLSPIRPGAITDGLSTTVVVVEHRNAALERLGQIDPEAFAKYGWMVTGNWGDTLMTSFYPINAADRLSPRAISAWVNSASSGHPGGVNVLKGDGSVTFIKETIASWPFDPETGRPVGIVEDPRGFWLHPPPLQLWQVLTTRDGGEIVSDTDRSF